MTDLQIVTPDRLRYEADAMFAAVQGEQYGDTFHAYNWDDKPHRVLYDAVGLMRDAATTLESLQRENAVLRTGHQKILEGYGPNHISAFCSYASRQALASTGGEHHAE